MAIYSNNRIAVYVINNSDKLWKLSSYSKSNMYKLPKSIIQMKTNILGAISNF